MELMTMLHARKAVREYTGQVTPDQLQQLLHAASAAPVGRGNYDNYRLTVIQKPESSSNSRGSMTHQPLLWFLRVKFEQVSTSQQEQSSIILN